jgi:eukaryotic-like serine/threonine-protein kinase
VEPTGQWEKLKELFEAALRREPGERPAFLRQACGADEWLRIEIESLLSDYARADGLSQHPFPQHFPPPAQALDFIGPYRLLEKIGGGGMGQVWLAEQPAPLRRRVALKLIKAGMYDDAMLHRFQSERQSLALMDHPSIAKVFDAGATPNGQPYFVMEYVPGLPITDYCDQNRMTIRERLELFVKACEGVQHAHQKAIIHRDLKPANILVVAVDGKPMPRIIDFGLAKAATPEMADEVSFTQIGGFVGTPGYMSPEQADPGVKDIDTRTDVYSLGVILYVLLAGFLPFDAKQWQRRPLHEVLEQLREPDPPRPSAKVEMESESSAKAAELRGTEAKPLASLLRGDLDWITLRAIEKDRTRRYGTPTELSADVLRYLNHEPVLARPAGARYRVQKYVRRHRVGVAVAAGLVFLLAGFAAVEAVQLRRTMTERDRADRIAEFMAGMFKVSDPSEARGNSITAREILDKASNEIDAGLAKDPALQAQMMSVMGKVYGNLGLYSRAELLLERAVAIRRGVLGPEHPDTLVSMHDLAWTFQKEGHYIEAERLLRETLDSRRRVLGPEHRDTLSSMSTLGWTLEEEGRYPEAEKLQRESVDLLRRVLGPDHPDTLTSMNNLAWTLNQEGRYGEAEKLNRDTLETRLRVLGPDHPDTLRTMSNLASVLNHESQEAEAEKLDRETLSIRQHVFGPDHPDTLMSMNNLANVLYLEGKLGEAEQLHRQALAINRRVLGPAHPDTIRSMINLGAVLNSEGHYADTEKLTREALAISQGALGPEHPLTLVTMNNLAETLTKLGNYAEAERLNRETLDIRRRVLGPEHPDALLSMTNLADTLSKVGNYAEAEKLLRQTLEIQRRVLGPALPDTLMSMNDLTNVLDSEGHYDEAEKLNRETLDIRRRVLGADHPDTAISTYNLGCIAARRGQRDEALSRLREALDHGLPQSVSAGMEKDPNLEALRGDPRFDALIVYAHGHAAAAQKAKSPVSEIGKLLPQ